MNQFLQVPLPDQDGPDESLHIGTLELMSSGELAYHLALLHWELFCNVRQFGNLERLFVNSRLIIVVF